MPDQPDQKIDHVVEARKGVDIAERTASPDDLGFAAVAQAHAQIAIAEQLQRLNDKLDGANFAGEFSGFFDLLREDIRNVVWHNTGGGR